MSAFLAMIRRDIVEKRYLFLGLLVIGTLIVFTPLLPKARGLGTPQDIRDAVSGFGAVIVTAGLAITMGFTTITRDLTEKRFSFYFSRPIPGFVIWAGKMAGVFAVAMLAGLLVLLPATLMGGGIITFLTGPTLDHRGMMSMVPALSPFLFMTLLVTALILFAHFLSVVLADRSLTLLADLIGWFVFGESLWLIGRFVAGTGAARLFSIFLISAAVVTLTAMAAAGAIQVVKGRTDLRRGHRLMSAGFWTIVAAFTLITLAYLKFVVSETPRGSAAAWLESAAPTGDWVSITGHTSSRLDYASQFLANARTGSYVRVRNNSIAFSADGATAAWFERESYPDPVWSLKLARLEDQATVRSTTLNISDGFPTFSLSADGGRLAVLARDTLSVYETRSLHSLATTRIARGKWKTRISFLTPDTVEILDEGGPISLLDVPTRRLTPTGAIPKELWNANSRILALRGSTMIYRNNSAPRTVYLLDSRTGSLIATLTISAVANVRVWASYLADGRIVAMQGEELRIFTSDGKLVKTFPLPKGDRIIPGGEITPGVIVFTALPQYQKGESYLEHSRLLALDTATGVIENKGENISSMPSFRASFSDSDPAFLDQPGSAATRVLEGRKGALLYLDPQSGERRVIAGGSEDSDS